jgi:RHS repeat-associated protein
VNDNGEIVDSNDNPAPLKRYDVYGAELTNISGTTDHKFVGKLGHKTEDNTGGLVYMGARYYDPTMGRFISEDPVGNGRNWYAYCGNNPVNLADPDGKTAYNLDGPALMTLGMMAVCEGVIIMTYSPPFIGKEGSLLGASMITSGLFLIWLGSWEARVGRSSFSDLMGYAAAIVTAYVLQTASISRAMKRIPGHIATVFGAATEAYAGFMTAALIDAMFPSAR